MSIALKHIKQGRFLPNKTEEITKISPELVKIDNIPEIPPSSAVETEKRPSEIAYIETFNPSEGKVSNSLLSPSISGLNGKFTQTPKNLDAQTLKYWENVFLDAPSLSEGELINRLLKIKELGETPVNNTRCLNEIFRDERAGYIKQTAPYSHIWVLK